MIRKLREKCGKGSVSSAVVMISDIHESADMNRQFRTWDSEGIPGGVELDVKLVRCGAWNITPTVIPILPAELNK